MLRLVCVALLALTGAGTGAAQLFRLRPPPIAARAFSLGDSFPGMGEIPQAAEAQASGKKETRAIQLQPQSRVDLIRYVSGEFARAVKPLPGGKKGYRIKVGGPVDEKELHQTVARYGSAGNPGDTVQVTRLEFKQKEILVHINGGGKGRTRWRDRIQVSVGGVPSVTTASGPPGFQGIGSTLILDFGRPVPDLTPDELKERLAGFLDFRKQRSAAVAWIETLPLEFQQAIKEKRAAVGMDREMVIAALGRPDQKVRERDPDGVETEDWIYGHPAAKTIFVKFVGDHVVSVKQFP